MGKTDELHKLLNSERTKRGLKPARWNQKLWHGCKSHCNYMLSTKRLVHASINTIPNGGECICGGKGKHSPQTIVKSWMNSPGHKALILSPSIRSHAVAITYGKYGTYATWRGSKDTINKSPKFVKWRHQKSSSSPWTKLGWLILASIVIYILFFSGLVCTG